MPYAVLSANTVLEIANPPSGFNAEPFIAAGLWVESNAAVVGMTYDPGSDTWASPATVSAGAPPPITMIAPSQFFARFTTPEFTGVCAAALSNVATFQFLLTSVSNNFVTLTDPGTIAGVNALANAGLIASSRVSTILATGA